VDTEDEMEKQELCEKAPRLFHLAIGEPWEQVKKRGLLSTSKLLDNVADRGQVDIRRSDGKRDQIRREHIESDLRTECYRVITDAGEAVVRDQKMDRTRLEELLEDDTCLEDRVRLLNNMVVFFADFSDSKKLREAYRHHTQTLFQFSTEKLTEDKGLCSRLHVTGINTGWIASWTRGKRGKRTFKPLFAHRGRIKEVTIKGGIEADELETVLDSVKIYRPNAVPEILYSREG